jgi:hypothetical protein
VCANCHIVNNNLFIYICFLILCCCFCLWKQNVYKKPNYVQIFVKSRLLECSFFLKEKREQVCLKREQKREVIEHKKINFSCFILEFTFCFILIEYNFIKDQLNYKWLSIIFIYLTEKYKSKLRGIKYNIPTCVQLVLRVTKKIYYLNLGWKSKKHYLLFDWI